MITKTYNNLLYYQFQNLSKYKEINHFTTTRKGGKSTNHLSSLNLGYTVNDNLQAVDKNHELLSEATGIARKHLVFPKQTNGTNLAIVKSINETFPDTDALITNIPGICICVRTADCVPVLLYEPRKKVIAAVHSGWKGTVEMISKKVIQIMVERFSIDPTKLIAGIGPSIGPEVYEIGPDVINLVNEAFSQNNILKYIPDTQKALFDLWEANKQILLKCGVKPENIEIAGMCTYSDADLFYSARRDGKLAGRLASGIIMI